MLYVRSLHSSRSFKGAQLSEQFQSLPDHEEHALLKFELEIQKLCILSFPVDIAVT